MRSQREAMAMAVMAAVVENLRPGSYPLPAEPEVRLRPGVPQTQILIVPGSEGKAGTTMRGIAKYGGEGVDLLHFDERSEVRLVIEWNGQSRDRSLAPFWGCGSTAAHARARQGEGDDDGPVAVRDMTPEEQHRWELARRWGKRAQGEGY